jgi:hypothetical protein
VAVFVLGVALGCRARPDTPLTAAAASGDTAALQSLIARGVPVDRPDGHGWTPLVWAARRGHPGAIRALAAAGADLDRHDTARHGWTALMHAIHTGQPDAVRTLLEAGADPNRRTRDLTPLLMAAAYGRTGMVGDLLDRGADPYAVASSGMTALSAAVGGAPDIDRFTVASCQTSTVRALLDRAPDLRIDSTSVAGRWALRFARLGDCTEVIGLVATRVEAANR